MFLLHGTQQGFIHIARTGGRYVESQVQNLPDFQLVPPRHRYRQELYPHYHWHMLVRDPVERFVSLYRLWSDRYQSQERVPITHQLSCPAAVFFDFDSYVHWFCQRHIRYASHWTEQHFYWDSTVTVWQREQIPDFLAHLGVCSTGEIINQNLGPDIPVDHANRQKIMEHFQVDYLVFGF